MLSAAVYICKTSRIALWGQFVNRFIKEGRQILGGILRETTDRQKTGLSFQSSFTTDNRCEPITAVSTNQIQEMEGSYTTKLV